jgi:hypothetical protein
VPILHTVLYGLLAGASALAAAAVIVVLRTQRTRINGIAFAIGFLAAQFLLTVIALSFGSESIPDTDAAHQTVTAIVEIVLGIGLLVAAQRIRHPHTAARHAPGPLATKLRTRQAEVLERVGALRPGAVLGTGALLGIGPKRLVLTMFAAAAIAASGASRTGETTLVALYVLLATALVWVPVVLALVWGARAAEWTAAAQRWWAEHRTMATFVPLVALGAYFVVIGVVDLANV